MKALMAGLLLALFTPVALAQVPQQVTTSPGSDLTPSWTADGTELVFGSNRSGTSQIYKISALGGTATQLTFESYACYHPEVSPDGSLIAYAFDGSGLWGVKVIPVNGGPPLTVASATDERFVHPTWSPDGSTIVTNCTGSGGFWNLCKFPSDGSGPWVPIVSGAVTTDNPEFSPDGTTLVYGLHQGGIYNLYSAPFANPTNRTQLTFESANTSQGQYSPDGLRLVYTSRKLGGDLELFELNLALGTTEQITFDVASTPFDPRAQNPTYSPDGTKLAFSSARVTGDENIWVLDRVPPEPLDNELIVGDGQGLPGPHPVTVTVSLENAAAVPALEFKIEDLPDVLTVTGITTLGRASGMTVSFQELTDTHVLVYNPGGGSIPPGLGDILALEVEVQGGTALGTLVDLLPGDIVMSDPDGAAVVVTTGSGSFLVERIPGDLNGDNLVDVGDLVRLVEIILGLGDPPTPDELAAADCNNDVSVNALDIVCLLENIVSPEMGITPPTPDTAIAVTTEVPVKGLQWTFSGPASVDKPRAAWSEARGTNHRGETQVLHYDAQGNSLEAGSEFTLPISSHLVEVRAYGEGGEPLAVTLLGNEVRIGSPATLVPLRILPPAPNPFLGSTQIRFSISEPEEVTVEFFDVRGARVASLPPRFLPAGSHTATWDAHDDRGMFLPTGIYFGMVTAGDHRATTRLVHLGR